MNNNRNSPQMTISSLINSLLISLSVMSCAKQNVQENDAASFSSRIDQISNDYFNPDAPGAAIIVTKEGETVYKKAFGMASIELNVKMDLDMIFRLGSMTKQFTAVAILLLEEQGKLKASDDIRVHLPDYPMHGAIIKIEHLLTHTSGIPDFTKFKSARKSGKETNLTTADKLAMFKDKPLDFLPGDRMSYSNSAYNVLGAIIEKVSGQSYEDFVEQNIFRQLEMKHSYYDHPEEVITSKILGYDKENEHYVRSPYFAMQLSFAAGGLRSSVADLAIWNDAVQSGRLLSKASREKAFHPFQLNNGEKSNYGFGWSMQSFLGDTTYAHGGSISGFRTSGYYFPATEYYIAILSNNTSYDPEYVTFLIAAHLLGKTIGQSFNGNAIKNADYVGKFKSGNTDIEIRADLNGLYFHSKRIEGKLIPTSLDAYYLDNTIFSCSFDRNPKDQVISITISHRFLGEKWFTAERIP